MSDHLPDQAAHDLSRLIAHLAACKDWVSARTLCRRLGLLTASGKPKTRYIATLKHESRGKIISSRTAPMGYKLMRHATQAEVDHYMAMMTATIEELQEGVQDAIRERNHWNKAKEQKWQMALL